MNEESNTVQARKLAEEVLVRDDTKIAEAQREYDELFQKVLASMNSGRWQPVPRAEHSLIWEVCAEVVDLRHKQGEGTRMSVWRLVSCYSDGDRIIEATFDQREDAERMIPRVYEFRSDQTEAPVDVVVEEA